MRPPPVPPPMFALQAYYRVTVEDFKIHPTTALYLPSPFYTRGDKHSHSCQQLTKTISSYNMLWFNSKTFKCFMQRICLTLLSLLGLSSASFPLFDFACFFCRDFQNFQTLFHIFHTKIFKP